MASSLLTTSVFHWGHGFADPELTVVETAPTIETTLPEARTETRQVPPPECKALVPYCPAPVPALAEPEASLSGFFFECAETREVGSPPARNRRGVRAIEDLLERRVWLIAHSLTVLAVGIVVGLLLGTFAR